MLSEFVYRLRACGMGRGTFFPHAKQLSAERHRTCQQTHGAPRIAPSTSQNNHGPARSLLETDEWWRL